LEANQAEKARQVADEAKKIIEAKDEARAEVALERVNTQIEELPVPVWDLFWSYWTMEQPQISAGERSQVNQTILQMENSAVHDDFDQANRHLGKLRTLNQTMLVKIPHNLLKTTRS